MIDRDDIPQKILLENSEEERSSTSEGALVVFEQDDYAEETKQTIGDFFRTKLQEENKRSVAQISDGPELEIFNETNPEDSNNSYIAKRPDEQRVAFERQSQSGFFNRDVVPGKAVVGIGQNEIQASALLDIVNETPGFIASEVENTIGENASFGPNQKYISNSENSEDTFVTEEVAGTRRHLIQTEFGTHGPQKLFDNVQVEEGITPTLTIQQLKNLGGQILLEASGEVFIPSDPSNIEQALAARGTTAAVPGAARLGFKVDRNRFGALQTLQANTNPDLIKPGVDIDLSSPSRGSYGSFNNPFVPFDGILTGLSSAVAGTLLAITFSEIFILLSEILSFERGTGEALSEINSIENGKPPEDSDTIATRRRRLGSYVPKRPEEDPNLERDPGDLGFALLGIDNANFLTDTQFSYRDALQQGVKIFFGLSNENFIPGVASAATKIVETPGYYNGILRSLTRAVTDPLFDIAGSVASLSGEDLSLQASDPGNVNPITGPSSDPTSLVGIIDVLRDSKFLKFMNVLAAIGDIALRQGTLISDIDSIRDTIENPNQQEGEPELIVNISSLHKKNRLSNRVEPQFRGALAWGSNTVRSMFLLNDKITQAEDIYSPETSNYTRLAGNRNVKLTKERRLSQTEVRLMERELDSYYVPFYFHDLRTNEIISFHAFLENITDSYDVIYNESEGYGRIGKVYSYQNTDRTITLSFKAVSTNPGDFSEMWYKINKLVMLLYPQYTAGRSVSFDSQKFIQPFSQIPSSTPLIRLRVGDLIKSNYSDFDLARLFGIGTESFQLSEQAREQNAEAQERLRLGQTEARIQFELYNFQVGDIFTFARPIDQVGSTVPRSSPESIIKVIENEQQFRERTRQRGRQRHNRTRLPSIPVGARARVVGAEAAAQKKYRIIFVPALTGTDGGTQYEIDFSGESAGMIIPDPISLLENAQRNAQVLQEEDGTATDQQITDFNNNESVRNFFATTDRDAEAVDANPIFKAFDSTRGQGLAGVIKSLAFNWDGAIWETEGLNNRAPKWCTIDITFAPVYDINPGLDANGNMIGAPYNIGTILDQIKITRNRDAEKLAAAVNNNRQASVSLDDEEDIDPDALANFLG